MTTRLPGNANWGPLNTLVGKWVGAREKQTSRQQVEQFYEVRTFRRRSTVHGLSHSQVVFPVLFSIRVYDFYRRDRQISEETGYLLWVPESKVVSQLTLQPTGTCRMERATVEEMEGTCCLIFDGRGESSGIFHADLSHVHSQLTSVESTIIFDSSTFRFDQNFLFQSPSEDDVSYRETGELIRIGP